MSDKITLPSDVDLGDGRRLRKGARVDPRLLKGRTVQVEKPVPTTAKSTAAKSSKPKADTPKTAKVPDKTSAPETEPAAKSV